MKYGIAIFPSKEIQDEANSYRKRYDPHYALIPPHITLKESFEADDQYTTELVEDLKKIAKEFEPITIEIKKVSSFAPVTNTLYLKIEPNETLNKLVDKMYSGNFPPEMEHPFVPHITIAQKLSQDEFSDVLGSTRMMTFNFQDIVDRFQLLYQLDNGSWTVYETFTLGQR